MRIGRTAQTSLILSGSILVALGLGPIISTGIADILNSGAAPVTVTSIVIAAIALCVAGGTFYWSERFRAASAMVSGKRNIVLILFGIVAIAVLSFNVAHIDDANSSAWRFTHSAEAGPGVSKTTLSEFGYHYANFGIARTETSISAIVTWPVNWYAWAAGGEWEYLIRVHEPEGPGSICNTGRSFTLSAVSQERSIVESVIPLVDDCDRWKKVHINAPPGAEALRIEFEHRQANEAFSVDILPVNSRVHLSWLWTFCIILALASALLFTLLASSELRAPEVKDAQHGQNGVTRLFSASTGGALLLFLLLSNIFVYWFVGQERTIYTWDNAGYWTSTRNVSEFIQGAERKSVVRQASALSRDATNLAVRDAGAAVPSPGAIAALVRNVRFAEYNVTTSIPVAPVMAIFGGSRMVYEMSLLNIYAFGAVLMLVLAVRACGGADTARWPTWWPLVPVLSVIFFVPFWVPLVRGYMGISIVGLNLAVLWLYFRQPIRSASTASLAAIGVLLVVGVFLQRWNAYWVVGFFILAFADSAFEFWRWRASSEVSLLQCLRAPLVAGFSAFFIFAVVAWPKIVTMVTTDYADIFSAYLEHTSLTMAFIRVASAFGLVLVIIIFWSAVYLAAISSTRRLALLLSIQVVYIFVHMSTTQTMGPHHLYLLMPAILSLMCVAVLRLVSSGERSAIISGGGIGLLFVTVGMASGASVFMPSDTRVAKPSSIGIISQDYRPPLVRSDLDEFIRLAEYVNTSLGKDSSSARLYVLAGSQTLNSEHFKNISASTGVDLDLEDRVLSASIVDKRDGFPEQILNAKLVVTSNPVQLSRRPSDQQVIRIPAESLLTGRNIGAAFERLPVTFELDGSVEVIVFRRTRSNTAEEIAELSEELKRFYPDRPYIYE